MTGSLGVHLKVALVFMLSVTLLGFSGTAFADEMETQDSGGSVAEPKQPIVYTEEEARELGLGCDYVQLPNGDTMECVDGKPPEYICIGFCLSGLDREASLAGRFRWGVSNFRLVDDGTSPEIYSRSQISLDVAKSPRMADGTPLPPVITAGGQAARLISFDGRRAIYEVVWREIGNVWLEATDFPSSHKLLVSVSPTSQRLNPLINSGMNQFLEWGNGLPRLSADTAYWDQKDKEYKVRGGSPNVITGAMNMPGQMIQGENTLDPEVSRRIEQWSAYPTITGTVRFTYLFPSRVIGKNSKAGPVASLFQTEPIAVYKPPEGLSGPIAVIPRTELARPIMFEGEACQIVNVVAEYDGDSNYNPAVTQFNVEFCPRRR